MCINNKNMICVVIATPITARLYNGTSWAGRLEILINGEWRTVCDKNLYDNEMKVTCKMLGFNRSVTGNYCLYTIQLQCYQALMHWIFIMLFKNSIK